MAIYLLYLSVDTKIFNIIDHSIQLNSTEKQTQGTFDMKKLMSILFASIFHVVACAQQAPNPQQTESIVNGFNQFTLDLFQNINQTDKNTIISPYSISILLNLLMQGSTGTTQNQLISLLHIQGIKNTKDVTQTLDAINTSLTLNTTDAKKNLIIANALWTNNNFSIKKNYLEMLSQYHGTELFSTPFATNPEQAREKINHWVENKTQGYIKELIPSGAITRETLLVLTNAIYFKGLWKFSFNKNSTAPAHFTLANGTKIQVPMMHLTEEVSYTEDDVLEMIQLSYKNSPLAMGIILPKAKHSWHETQNYLTNIKFIQLQQSLKSQELRVSLPKFNIESTFENLKDTMIALGLTEAFSDKAQFTNITDNPLFISKIIQKAIVKVDEEGTVAAAATGMIGLTSARLIEKEFNANHPFIFIIYDSQSKLILFIGQVSRP